MDVLKVGVQVGRVGLWLVGLSYRYRLCFERRAWIAALGGAVLGLVISLALGLPLYATLGAGGVLALLLVALAARSWSLRRSEKPLLALISRFAPSSAGASDASRDHQLLLAEAIETGDGLEELAEARKLEPLTRKQAARVLAECSACAAVYGTVRVQGDQWMALGGLLLEPPPAATEPAAGAQGAPPRHRLVDDRNRPLSELVGHPITPHLLMVRAELLRLAVA